jgi:hypothetical protein
VKRTSILKLVLAVGAVSVAFGVGANVASAHGFCLGAACPATTTRNVVPTAVPLNQAGANDCPAGTLIAVAFPLLTGFSGTTSQSFGPVMSGGLTFSGSVTITYDPATNHLNFTVTNTGTGQAVVAQERMHGGSGGGGVNATNIYTYTGFPAGGVLSDTALHFSGPSSNALFCLNPAAQFAVAAHSLNATRKGKNVTLRWRTAAEQDTLGFYVYRVTKGKLARLSKLIPAKALTGSASSHAYSFSKQLKSAKLAASSRYKLAEVHPDGKRTWYGPVRAVAAT